MGSQKQVAIKPVAVIDERTELKKIETVVKDDRSSRQQIAKAIDALIGKLDKSKNSALIATLNNFKDEVETSKRTQISKNERDDLIENFYISFSQYLVERAKAGESAEDRKRKENAVKAIGYIDKGKDLEDADYSKMSELKDELKKIAKGKLEDKEAIGRIAKTLQGFGMTADEAKWYAGKIYGDAEYKNLIMAFEWTPTSKPNVLINNARDTLDKLYTAAKPDEIGQIGKELGDQYNQGNESVKAAMEFAISRRYGDIKDIAKRINSFYALQRKQGIKVPNDVEIAQRNTTVLINILTAVKDDREFGKNLKKYESDGGHSLEALGNMDAIGKYAFIRISYPELVKAYGDISTFVDYMENTKIPNQIQFEVFGEVVPHMVGHNTLDNIQNAIGAIALYGQTVLERSGWNLEKQLYTQGTKLLGVVRRVENDFLMNLLSASLEEPFETSAANKTSLPTESSFDQKSEFDRLWDKIRDYMRTYEPKLEDQLARMVKVDEVKDPEALVNAFRRLMRGRGFGLVKMGRGRVEDIGMMLDLAQFQKELNALMVVDPMPELITRASIKGSGEWAYKKQDETESASGSQTIEVTRWGPVASEKVSADLTTTTDAKPAYTLKAEGKNLYRLGGQSVDYGAEYMEEGEKRQLEASADLFKGDANTWVHLKRTEEDAKTYEAIVYRKDGGVYKKVAVHQLDENEAANLFAGYASYRGDARALFKENSVKGLIVAYKLPARVGVAALSNPEEFSAIATFTSPYNKVGARIYANKAGAEQLGTTLMRKNLMAEAVGGKQDEDSVYAINVRARTGKARISAMAAEHVNRLYAIGIDSQNAYAIVDYLRENSTDSYGIITGATMKDVEIRGKKGELALDLAWYSEKREVAYYREDIYTLNELLAARKDLQQAIREGNVDNVDEKLKYVNQGIDYMRTAIGNTINTAMTAKYARDDGKYGIEFVGGDSFMFNVYREGKVESNRLMGSWGDTTSLEYARVKKQSETAATLISAGVLSNDDMYALASFKYGKAYEPTRKERQEEVRGRGWLAGVDVGEGYDAASAAYLKWYEPFAQAKRHYSALIGRADYSEHKDVSPLTSAAIGWGRTVREYQEGGSTAYTVYVITNGALTEGSVGKIVDAVSAELGLNLKAAETGGKTYSVTASGRYVQVVGEDAHGTKITISIEGYYEWPVRKS